MQRCYIGDALDFWKAAMIALARDGERRMNVLPLPTDGNWSRQDNARYAAVLGIALEDIKARVDEIDVAADLFVDPDTGVEPPGGCLPQHVSLEVLRQALQVPDRLVVVYQHRPRIPGPGWLNLIGERLVTAAHVHVAGYESPQVGMLFASGRLARVRHVHEQLVRRLGSQERVSLLIGSTAMGGGNRSS